MKTSKLTNIAMIALFSGSLIVLNNCGNQSDSAEEQNYNSNLEGSASEQYIGVLDSNGALEAGVYVEISCNDGRDNDGDGLTDCMDSDCHIHPECSEFGPPLEELINGSANVIYPNGLITDEEVVYLKARGADDDDHHRYFQRDNFFATHQRDCWIAPVYQDPYYNIPLGDPLVAGPDGAIGPQVDGASVFAAYGPRAGLINECELDSELMTHHMDDDNGAGAGASGDTDDDDGGSDDEE